MDIDLVSLSHLQGSGFFVVEMAKKGFIIHLFLRMLLTFHTINRTHF